MRLTRGSRRTPRTLVLLTCLVLAWACQPAAPPADAPPEIEGAAQTPLDLYVATPDPAYRWEAVSEIEGDGFSATVIDLTSQTWLTEAEVDRPEWQ
ncbi:MAG: PhoPQ-activated protein PqaA family protein, partial [Pseudomonadota bacterium]